MRTIQICAVLALALAAGACRSSEGAKKRLMDIAERHKKEGRLKEASLTYRNIIKRDLRYGDAYLQLAEVDLRRGEFGDAIRAYRRAAELLPNNPLPSSRLGDIFLMAYATQQRKDERWLTEVRDISKLLLKRDPNSFDGQRLQGLLHAVEGNFPEAIKYFRKADSIKPGTPEILYALIQAETANDNFAEGERLALSVIAKNKAYAPAYDFLFSQYLKRKEPQKAEDILKLKASNNPKSKYFQLQMASFYWASQRRDDAVRVLDSLIANKGDFPEGKLDAADFYFRAGDVEKAESMYRQAITELPAKETDIKMRLVLLNVGRNRAPEAMKLTEEIIQKDPQNFDALQARAALRLQTDDSNLRTQALSDLNALVNRDPRNAVVRFNLGRAYQQKNELASAQVQYSEAVKIRPDFVQARVALVQVLAARGDFGKAIAEADEALRVAPNNLPARVLKANALLLNGGVRQARVELDAAKKIAPNLLEIKFLEAGVELADRNFKAAEGLLMDLRKTLPNDLRPTLAYTSLLEQTGRADQAMAVLRQEIEKPGSPNRLRLALAGTAFRARQFDVAVGEYKAILSKDPNDYVTYMTFGETLRIMGKLDESETYLRRGRALQPGEPLGTLQLAMTLELKGRKGEAKPLYEEVLKVQPNNFVALNNLAYMIADEGGDLDAALTMAQKAKQTMPLSDDVSDTIGWIYIKKNLSDNAIQIYNELVRKQPKRSEFHYHLGMALYQKGDKPKAKASLQTALANSPPKDVEAKVKDLLGRIG